MIETLARKAFPVTTVLAAGGLALAGCSVGEAPAATSTTKCEVFQEGSSQILPPESLPEAWPTGKVTVGYDTANSHFSYYNAKGTTTYDKATNTYSMKVSGLPLLPGSTEPSPSPSSLSVLGASDLGDAANTAAVIELHDIQDRIYELSSACIQQTVVGNTTSNVVQLPVAPSIVLPSP